MTSYSMFRATPVTAALGAEIDGIDLNAPLTEVMQTELRDALSEHLVLFFRDQFIDDEAHLALASCFGEPEVPCAGVLRCEETPPAGGDTLWANMQLAYEKLSDGMKTYLSGLQGFHATDGGFIDYIQRHLPEDAVEKIMKAVGTGASHPLVRTHPVSGRKSLFVDRAYLGRIEGISKDESVAMLEFLSSRVQDVSIQCRFHWTTGAVAIWDERATQHSGSADHRGSARILRRCTVAGERPS